MGTLTSDLPAANTKNWQCGKVVHEKKSLESIIELTSSCQNNLVHSLQDISMVNRFGNTNKPELLLLREFLLAFSFSFHSRCGEWKPPLSIYP